MLQICDSVRLKVKLALIAENISEYCRKYIMKTDLHT